MGSLRVGFRAATVHLLCGTAVICSALLAVIAHDGLRVALGEREGIGPAVWVLGGGLMVFCLGYTVRILWFHGQGGSRREGDPLRIEILTNNGNRMRRDMLVKIQEQLSRVGVEVQLRPMEPKAMRQQISSAVNFIVQQSRQRDGTRKVTKVTEITGMEGDVISAQDIFQFVQTGVDSEGKVEGYFECTGIRPRVTETLEACGIELGDEFFLHRRLS